MLIAVSKTRSIAEITEVMEAGQCDFGENYVQEAIPKILALPQLTWHFIGRIQSNKIKDIAQYFDVVHTLGSLAHAQKLNQACQALDKVMDVFIQVNLAAEPQKGGVEVHDLETLIRGIKPLSHLNLIGLMLIPEADLTDEALKANFGRMATLLKEYESMAGAAFNSLSMGMSRDYKLALEMGATHVRLGEAIFGVR